MLFAVIRSLVLAKLLAMVVRRLQARDVSTPRRAAR
jgi:hypothetical protein